jgi:hypothetical protein
MKKLVCWILVAWFGATAYSQLRDPSQAVIYEGGRLIMRENLRSGKS